MNKLLQSQLSLVKLSQQSIENALTSDTLAEYQNAMVALRFIGQLSGKLNATRELINRKDEIFFVSITEDLKYQMLLTGTISVIMSKIFPEISNDRFSRIKNENRPHNKGAVSGAWV